MAQAWMSWSSGKDSTMALAEARAAGVDVVALLVTFNGDADRVAMHAVRRSLVEAQADRLRLELVAIDLPAVCSNDEYEARMAVALDRARSAGIEQVVFGDLFLADVRAYRQAAMAGTGLVPAFPLWDRPSSQLAGDAIAAGVRAVVTCVDPRQLDPSFVGRSFDQRFLDDLPPGVDPCGEHGEFHTFVWDGPGFSSPIPVSTGEVVERDGFVFTDVLPQPPS